LILAIAQKDLKLLWRDKAAMFWTLGFPILIAVLFGSIFGGSSAAAKIKIAVIDQDQSPKSERLVERLRQKTDALDVSTVTLEDAKNQVRKGVLVAYLVIPSGYGEHSNPFAASQSKLVLGIDPKRSAEQGYLKGILTEAVFQELQEMFSHPTQFRTEIAQQRKLIEADPSFAKPEKQKLLKFMEQAEAFVQSIPSTQGSRNGGLRPPAIEVQPLGETASSPKSAFEITFPQAIIWGLLGVVTTFAITIVKERTQGTLLRLRVAPITPASMLAGKAAACFAACAGVMVALLALGAIVFHVRISHVTLLGLAVASSAICFVGIMMLLSVLGRTENAVAGSSWGVLVFCSMIGGGMVPLMAMPAWMQQVSAVSPVKWAILALEGAIWRGFSFVEMLPPCSVLIVLGIVCFAVGAKLFQARKD